MTADATHPTAGLAACVLAAVLWAFGGIFVAISTAPVLVFTLYRLGLGAVLLTIITLAMGQKVSWETLRASWMGGVLLAADMALFYTAVRLTSIVAATVIGAFQPVLVFLFARRMFGERMGRWDVGWIALAFASVVVTVLGAASSGRHQVLGDELAFASLLCWTGYWLVSKRTRQNIGAMQYTTNVTITAAIVTAPVALVSGESFTRFSPGNWTWLALLTLIAGSGHLFVNWAHRSVDASVSAGIGNLSPLVAALAAVPILGQPLGAVQVAGLVVGLAAISAVAARHRVSVGSPLE